MCRLNCSSHVTNVQITVEILNPEVHIANADDVLYDPVNDNDTISIPGDIREMNGFLVNFVHRFNILFNFIQHMTNSKAYLTTLL